MGLYLQLALFFKVFHLFKGEKSNHNLVSCDFLSVLHLFFQTKHATKSGLISFCTSFSNPPATFTGHPLPNPSRRSSQGGHLGAALAASAVLRRLGIRLGLRSGHGGSLEWADDLCGDLGLVGWLAFSGWFLAFWFGLGLFFVGICYNMSFLGVFCASFCFQWFSSVFHGHGAVFQGFRFFHFYGFVFFLGLSYSAILVYL